LQVESLSAGVLLCRLVGELPEPAIRRVSYKPIPALDYLTSHSMKWRNIQDP